MKINKQTHNNESQSAAHHEEHEKWNRRSFLQALGLAGTGTIMMGGTNLSVSAQSALSTALTNTESDRILVLIRLKGGNDGLNTIVPLNQYGAYEELRPTLKHNLGDLYNLSDDFAMPNFMSDLQSMWGNGAMKVVQGVGYEDSSFSHFKGSDIWSSSDPTDVIKKGIFGRYFDETFPDFLLDPPLVPPAIKIGAQGNILFDGNPGDYSFAVNNPAQLNNIGQSGNLYDVVNLPDCTYGDQLGFLRSTTNTTVEYSDVIHNAYINSASSVEYTDSSFGRSLLNTARLIKGDLGTRLYLVSLDGFDTHSGQSAVHQSILTELSQNIKLFFDDLAATGKDQNVLAMTISEFGRRPYENGSNGTDHGTTAPLLLFGSGLNGNGFIGNHPSLTEEDERGNLVYNYNIDFREIYATVMAEWLCIDQGTVNQALLGQSFNSIPAGFSCTSLSINDNTVEEGFVHYASYNEEDTYVNFKLNKTQHVLIKVYDILGHQLDTIKDEYLFPGPHKFDVKKEIGIGLSPGYYIYRISTGNKNYSKQMLIK